MALLKLKLTEKVIKNDMWMLCESSTLVQKCDSWKKKNKQTKNWRFRETDLNDKGKFESSFCVS